MNVKRHFIALFSLVCCLFLFAGTSAADSFTLTYYDTATGGSAVNVLANLQATNDGGGVYSVTGITGTYDGHNITGLTSDNGFIWDNLLTYPSTSGNPSFDYKGLLFGVSGVGSVNLCANPNCSELNTSSLYTSISDSSSSGYVFTDVTVNVTNSPASAEDINTPEPASFVLMGTGVMGLLGGLRRKLKK